MKNFFSICVLVVSITAAFSNENETHADVGGIKLVLTKKGLDFAAALLVEFLDETVKGARIDYIVGTTETRTAYIDYLLKDNIIQSFKKPSATVILDPFRGLTLTLSGAELTATSKWEYKYRAGLIKFGDQGSFNASAKGMSIVVSVSVKKSESGSPKVTTTDCKCSIKDVQIDISSRANWFYNMLLKNHNYKIKTYFENRLCQEAKTTINGMTSKYLDNLNMQIKVNDVLTLNYALVGDPIFRTDIISFRFNGRFEGDSVQERAPLTAASRSQMISLTVSDITCNSALRVLYETGQLQFSLDLEDDILVRAVFGLLNEAGVSLNGTGLTVSVELSAPPLVSIKPGNLSISGEIESNIIVQNADGSNSSALTLKVAIYAQLEAWISNNRIFGAVKEFKSNLTYLSIPDDKAENLKTTISSVTMLLLPAVNELLAEGFPIYKIYGIEFHESMIRFHERYISVGTNFVNVGSLLN